MEKIKALLVDDEVRPNRRSDAHFAGLLTVNIPRVAGYGRIGG